MHHALLTAIASILLGVWGRQHPSAQMLDEHICCKCSARNVQRAGNVQLRLRGSLLSISKPAHMTWIVGYSGTACTLQSDCSLACTAVSNCELVQGKRADAIASLAVLETPETAVPFPTTCP